MRIEYTIPRLHLPSIANISEHWARRRRLKEEHRGFGYGYTLDAIGTQPPVFGNLVITIKRVAKRRLDTDNLQSACKSLRDGIADALGRNDGNNSGIAWKYDQGLCGKAEPWVEVTIEEA